MRLSVLILGLSTLGSGQRYLGVPVWLSCGAKHAHVSEIPLRGPVGKGRIAVGVIVDPRGVASGFLVDDPISPVDCMVKDATLVPDGWVVDKEVPGTRTMQFGEAYKIRKH